MKFILDLYGTYETMLILLFRIITFISVIFGSIAQISHSL